VGHFRSTFFDASGLRHRLLWDLNSFSRFPSAAHPLMPKSCDHVKQNRKHNTYENRGRQRKIKCGVLAAINDVAGKASERNVGTPEQDEGNSDNDEQSTQRYEGFAWISHLAEFKSVGGVFQKSKAADRSIRPTRT
jgi:hypothetical protein